MNSIIQFFTLSFFMVSVKTMAVDRVPVGSPPVGSPPGINVNLTSELVLTTLGLTGEAQANQQILEGAVGSSDVPASLVSQSSNVAVVDMSGTIDEVAVVHVDAPQETVGTLNAVNTEFLTGASEQQIQATLSGVNAAIEYSGESVVPLGGGVTFSNANTVVEIVDDEGRK